MAVKGHIPWNKGKTLETDSRIISYWSGKKRNFTHAVIINKVCPTCSKEYSVKQMMKKQVYCSLKCRPRTPNYGSKGFTKGISPWNKGKPYIQIQGEKHPNWIADRSLIKGQDRRDNPLYKEWRKQVWLRDNFTCKIANPNCAGRIEAHHILGYKDYPELRYQTNNGITLCHAHHPRARAEEKRLIPTFQELVSMSVSK